MQRALIIEKLKGILKPYTPNPETLHGFSENSNFINDLQINSANMVDVFLDAEDIFNIVLDNESLEQISSVKDAIDIIEKKLQGSEQPFGVS